MRSVSKGRQATGRRIAAWIIALSVIPGATTRTHAARSSHVRWLNMIERRLEAKAGEMSRGRRFTGKVVICFHVGPDGRVTNRDICVKSGDAAGDRLALDIVAAASPFPPAPASEHGQGLVWTHAFEGSPSN